MEGDPAIVAVYYPQFFGHPLERHIAPRHAFLVDSGRPSGGNRLALRRYVRGDLIFFVCRHEPGMGQVTGGYNTAKPSLLGNGWRSI